MKRASVLAALALVPLLAGAQGTTDNILDTMRATLVTGPQRVQLKGAALESFQPLFKEAKRTVPVFGETVVLSRTSTQPACGRVSIRLTPVGITGKSPITGAVEQVYWDLAYNLCAESAAPGPDALARAAGRPGSVSRPSDVGLRR